MARSACSCGAQILWKADEPESDEWLLAAKPDVPDDLNHISLGTASTSCAFCSACGHLWIAWTDAVDATEYTPVDSAARPVRRS